MGSIKKTKNGTYRVRVSYYDDEGNRRYLTGTTEKSKDAKQLERSLEDEVNAIKSRGSTPLFRQYADDYIEVYRKGVVSSASVDLDKFSLKHLKTHYTGNIKVDGIKGTDQQKLINKLFDEGYSLSTIKKINSLMYRIMDRARIDGFITINPAELIQYRRTDIAKKAEYIPRDKIKPFLDDVKRRNIYHYYLFRLILETGLRVGEACALTYDDIDTENNILNVTKSYDQKRDMLGTTKTKHHRTIYISDELIEQLEQLKTIDQSNRNAFGQGYYNKYNFIFVDATGTPISRSSVHNTMMYCTKKVMGDDFQMSVHKLRHTHATLLLESNVPLKVIQDRLGHQSVEMTERIYAHVTPALKKQGQEMVEKSIKELF
ncbi:tyrosine-type recombinase/integrase [Macrococcus brunensis]|uniref:tyrosine-type recombinase/integrase n=1 Tax=Macrococcus brunensis TaxID=198483 RepID=UPI001EF0590A|nr:site-specific integrase [Macrococcus brunensis]ULG72970.1 site-specific integrase [Macrococcus brunensis]